MLSYHDIQLSKTLAWLLRHGAAKEGLFLSPNGYLDLETVLHHRAFARYSVNDIQRLIRYDLARNFQLNYNRDSRCWEIRATYGRTIGDVTSNDLTPIVQAKYPFVIHGTFSRAWRSIEKEGISRMARNHIHLAFGIHTTNINSPVRQYSEIHIYIDLKKALADGIKFYESANHFILTPGNERGYLPPKYFIEVVEVETGIVIYP